MHNEPILTLN